MREEAVEERDEHFNTIRPMIPTKQEWRVKEKVAAPALTTSDDDMDLMDDDESPLIKDRSPPPTGMDINMVFTLSAEFKGVEGEVAQMCLVYYDNVSAVYLSTNPFSTSAPSMLRLIFTLSASTLSSRIFMSSTSRRLHSLPTSSPRGCPPWCSRSFDPVSTSAMARISTGG
jgi:hypothetical protein